MANNSFNAFINLIKQREEEEFTDNQKAAIQILGEHIRDMQGQGITTEKRKNMLDALVNDWMPDVDFESVTPFQNVYGALTDPEKKTLMLNRFEVDVTEGVARNFFKKFEDFADAFYKAGDANGNENENNNNEHENNENENENNENERRLHGGRRKRSKKTRKHKKHTKKTRKHKKHSKKTRKH